MAKYTNTTNIPLSMAVYLAHDDYDHDNTPKTISVTSLLRPLKQTILASRLTGEGEVDINTRIASTIGTSIHTGMEVAWVKHYEQSMLDLGYPQKVIDKVLINPTQDEADAFKEYTNTNCIPVYLERRTKKEINGWTVSGKFDMVMEGRVKDLKTTSVYNFTNGSNKENYILQGSIYRWLNQDIITDDYMDIIYYLKDWTKLGLTKDKDFPKQPIFETAYPLKSLPVIERYVGDRINQLVSLFDEPESAMPQCNDQDLWMKASVWKYYKNPKSTGRSTKNFANPFDAAQRLATDGHVGVVVEKKAQAIACRWCPALAICQQAKNLVTMGLLVI